MELQTIIQNITGSANAFKNRIEDKVLFVDNPALSHSEKIEKKALRSKKNKLKKFISKKEKSKIIHCPKEEYSYNAFLPLNKLWNQYILEVIGQGNNIYQSFPKLIRADYHGAILTVVSASSKSLVNMTGIVIRESMHCFDIITEENKVKKIPKKKTNFTFQINSVMYTLYGSQFISRSADRITKKFKGSSSIEIK